MQILAREIPQAAHAAVDQTARDRRRVAARDGEHRRIRVMRLEECVERAAVPHLIAAEGLARQRGIGVKRAQQAKPAGCKVKVVEQRAAQIARAQQDRRAPGAQAEDRAQLLLQFVDIIPIALLSKAAKAVEILPDLRSGQPHAFRQRAGRDTLHAFRLQFADVPVIAGQPLDHRLGNLLLTFHRVPSFSLSPFSPPPAPGAARLAGQSAAIVSST